jgi:hypothetical protein
MNKSELALSTLSKIRGIIDDEDIGFDNPEAEKRIAGLIKILKMQSSGFLPDNTQQIYLGEQIEKLDEYRRDLFRDKKPRFWQNHARCQEDMKTRCDIAQGLIERHARDYEI